MTHLEYNNFKKIGGDEHKGTRFVVSRKSNMIRYILKISLFMVAIISTGGQSKIPQQVCTLNLPIEISPVSTCDEKQDNNSTWLKEKVIQLEDKVDRILLLLNDSSNNKNSVKNPSSPLLHSCEDIKAAWPDSPSDYYIIADPAGHARHVYCNMEKLCGDSEGGWMRVAYLNMTDSTEDCPQWFKLYEENGIRACGVHSSGCQSVKFSSYSISYTEVCGRVTGYQKGSPDGIRSNSDINGAYVDGVSLTRGNPRQHIWTFMAALQENFFFINGENECPCVPNSPVERPSFVGSDYFCESGSPSNYDHTTLHTDDPLWDGKQCGLIEKACCNASGIPWFHKVLQQPTTDYIELRVCNDQGIADEDSPIGFYEIYVK